MGYVQQNMQVINHKEKG